MIKLFGFDVNLVVVAVILLATAFALFTFSFYYFALGIGWAVGAALQQLKLSADRKKLLITVAINLLFPLAAMYIDYLRESKEFVK